MAKKLRQLKQAPLPRPRRDSRGVVSWVRTVHSAEKTPAPADRCSRPTARWMCSFDGESASLADVLDECRSGGLMMQYSSIVVDHADRLVKSDDEEEGGSGGAGGRARGRGGRVRTPREILMQYVEEAPSEQATLVLRADRWYPGNLDKAIAKVGIVVKCEVPKREDAIEWAIKRCKKRARRDDRAGARRSCSSITSGANWGRIDPGTRQLDDGEPGFADYAGRGARDGGCDARGRNLDEPEPADDGERERRPVAASPPHRRSRRTRCRSCTRTSICRGNCTRCREG